MSIRILISISIFNYFLISAAGATDIDWKNYRTYSISIQPAEAQSSSDMKEFKKYVEDNMNLLGYSRVKSGSNEKEKLFVIVGQKNELKIDRKKVIDKRYECRSILNPKFPLGKGDPLYVTECGDKERISYDLKPRSIFVPEVTFYDSLNSSEKLWEGRFVQEDQGLRFYGMADINDIANYGIADIVNVIMKKAPSPRSDEISSSDLKEKIGLVLKKTFLWCNNVTFIDPASPAYMAGLRKNDRVDFIDDYYLISIADKPKKNLLAYASTRKTVWKVKRKREELTFIVDMSRKSGGSKVSSDSFSRAH